MAGGPLDDELEALATGRLSFDDLMKNSGVQRMGGTPKATPKRPAKAPAKAPQPAPAPVADPRLAQLEAKVASLTGQVEALTADLASATQSLTAATDQLAAAEQRLTERETFTLAQLLDERGLRGDVRGLAIRALIDAHRWDALAGLLDVVDLRRARRVVAHHLVLHCGEGDCPLPEHLAAVSTGRPRCELCGGRGQQGLLRAVSDALLLSGVTRVALLNGPTAQLRVLIDGLDERVECTRIRTLDEVGDAQLVLAWGEAVEGAVVVERGLASVLDAVTAWSER